MGYMGLSFGKELSLSERLHSTDKCLFCNQDVEDKISISTVVAQKTQTAREKLSGTDYVKVTQSYHNFTPFSFCVCKQCVDDYFVIGWHKKVWTDRAFAVGGPTFFAVVAYIAGLFFQSDKGSNSSGCLAILVILLLALGYCVWEVAIHSKTIPSTMPEDTQRKADECSQDGKRYQIGIKIGSLVYPATTKEADRNLVWWYKDDFVRDIEPHLKFR